MHVHAHMHTHYTYATLCAQVEATTFAESEGWATRNLEEVALKVGVCVGLGRDVYSE